MRSHLLDGVVRHRRVRPFAYALQHRVFYVALDLDELDEVPQRIRSISRGRSNVLSFRDGDHLDRVMCRSVYNKYRSGRGFAPCFNAHWV